MRYAGCVNNGASSIPRPSRRPFTILVCLGQAGSGAAEFRNWARAARGPLDVRAIRLPGREWRLGEPNLSSLSEAVSCIIAELEENFGPNERFGLYGQCSG